VHQATQQVVLSSTSALVTFDVTGALPGAATLQVSQGGASHSVPGATTVVSGGDGHLSLNLIAPGALYGDRVNEIDLRLAKVLRFGRTRTNVGFDIYNIFNSNPVLTYNNAFIPNGGAWLVPTNVLQSRFVKFSASFDF